MKKLFILTCLILITNLLMAQADEAGDQTSENPKQNIGIGLGMDYGGIGLRFTVMPSPKFGLFASAGYVFVGPGFNFGFNYKFTPDKRVTPVLGAMYGYNAAIKIVGASQHDKIYYGPSVSFGLEVKTRRNERNFWNFELVLPFRSGEYQDDIDALKNNSSIELNEPLPVAFSIGYHFGLN